MLAFVDAIATVRLDVGPQVVSTSIPLTADVAGEWLLSGVNPHVSAEVRGSYEAMAAYFAEERAFRLSPVAGLVLSNLDDLFFSLDHVRFNEIHKLDSVVGRTAGTHCLHT